MFVFQNLFKKTVNNIAGSSVQTMFSYVFSVMVILTSMLEVTQCQRHGQTEDIL